MEYTIIDIDIMGETQSHVLLDHGDGSFTSFPVDESNPRYQEWLSEGNEPEVIEEP